MAIAVLTNGSQAVDTTEWSITTDSAGPDAETTDGVFQIFLDVSDMTTGDELQIRIYEKVRSGDTQRIVYQQNLFGPQATPIYVTPGLVLMHGWDCTLDAIAGTITVFWKILQVS